MSVKRFVAADMRRALELVRQEMGPDAIILSSQRVKNGVEILTTVQPQSYSVSPQLPVDRAVNGVDVPMASDGAWRDQQVVEQAITQHNTLRGSRLNEVSEPTSSGGSLQGVSSAQTRREPSVSNTRGVASGKTQAELAQEMELARRKMLAAREGQSFEDTPIGQLSQQMDQRESDSAAARAVAKARNIASAQPAYGVDHRDLQEASRVDQRTDSHEAFEVEQQAQMQALQAELADMRLLLEEQLTRMANTPQMSTPLHSGLMRRLKHMGMSDSSAQGVVKAVKGQSTIAQAWTETLAVLAHQLPTAHSDRVMAGGVFAFVGPTGVGKTTTIAKLAARYVLEHGPQSVALVTTDTYRIAAHDQLRSMARILNVQVKVVDDNSDLPAVLRSLKGCPLVLIDTAGFRHGDSRLREQLDALNAIDNVQTLLVMACNSQLQMMKATVHAHQYATLAGCVLTKLDETASLGEAISVLLEHKLPLYYTTDGQEIPQDIQLAKGHGVVSKAVGLMKAGLGGQCGDSVAPLKGAAGASVPAYGEPHY